MNISQPYWKRSHKCFYCKVRYPDGRREERRLDPDPQAADMARSELVVSLANCEAPSAEMSVKDLLNLFLEWAEANTRPNTYRSYRGFLRSFSETIPAKLRVRELRLHHADRWLSKHYPRTGNLNTRLDAVAALKRVFNWASRDMGFIAANPLVNLKKGTRTRRNVCPTLEQWAQVQRLVPMNHPFYDFLAFLLATGCRPQEARVVTAGHINFATLTVHFEDGEVPGKKGSRDIPLTAEAVAILRKWALKNPQGPVFRNTKGRPWLAGALGKYFPRLRRKGVDFRVCCYGTRHSVGTALAEHGVPAGPAAAALGDEPRTYLQFYGRHIEGRSEHLRECLEQVTGKGQPKTKEGGPQTAAG